MLCQSLSLVPGLLFILPIIPTPMLDSVPSDHTPKQCIHPTIASAFGRAADILRGQ